MKSNHSSIISSTGETSAQNAMKLQSTLFLAHLSTTLVFGQVQQRDRTTRRPGKGEPQGGGKAFTENRGRQPRSFGSKANLDCQDGDSWGVSYSGNMNHTTSGRACQAWSAQEPHESDYTGVGEHNYCRNPDGDSGGVWCYTTDPNKQWEYCSVPICGQMMKVLDFSADNDHEPDSNGEYTSATLEAGPLPESFIICSAFMVEAWTTDFSEAVLFTLLDNNGITWANINLYATPSSTEYEVHFGLVFYIKLRTYSSPSNGHIPASP